MSWIQISKGYSAEVDEDLFGRIARYNWTADVRDNGLVYAYRAVRQGSRRRKIYMHHEVYGSVIRLDHRDGNGLNNQRANLRLATARQNLLNTPKRPGSSSTRGVYYSKDRQRWCAQISINGKVTSLGRFYNEEDAVAARTAAESARPEYAEFSRREGL